MLALSRVMVLNRLKVRLVLLVLGDMRCVLGHLKAHLVRQSLHYLCSTRFLLNGLLPLCPMVIEVDTGLSHRGLYGFSLVTQFPRFVNFLGLGIVVDLLLVAGCLLKESVTWFAERLLERGVLV